MQSTHITYSEIRELDERYPGIFGNRRRRICQTGEPIYTILEFLELKTAAETQMTRARGHTSLWSTALLRVDQPPWL
jgi:hypothetical protein